MTATGHDLLRNFLAMGVAAHSGGPGVRREAA